MTWPNAVPLTPSNSLEQAIADGQRGRLPVVDVIRAILRSDLIVPSETEVVADGSGLTPLLYEKDGKCLIAAFTSLDRVSQSGLKMPYALVVRGSHLFERVAREYGFVLNPGFSVGIEINSDGVQRAVRELIRAS